jgi:pimeloyl-ACP methyl ester carboxylesterase
MTDQNGNIFPMPDSPDKIISDLEAGSETHRYPCGDGTLPVRYWACTDALTDKKAGRPVEKVILLHGGSGSWLHWIRNIEALRAEFDVFALDLPGLGDAGMFQGEYDAEDAASVTADSIRGLVSGPFHIVAFSWGCTVTAMMMQRLASQLKSVMLVGPAAVGDLPRRSRMKPLIKRNPGMSRAEIADTHKENLARLMIHDTDRIDELAVQVQTINTGKARFSSPQFARSTLVLEGLADTNTPLYVIYGEYDAPAYPDLEARRQVFSEIRPDARFELIPDGGHWLQYECSDEFNSRCIAWINDHR